MKLTACTLAALSCSLAACATADVGAGRVFSDPALAGDSALDTIAIAWSRSELDVAQSALAKLESASRREWLLGRLELERGDATAACAHLSAAARALADGEAAKWPAHLLSQFDLDRANAAAAADSLRLLDEVLLSPLGSHAEDAQWKAQLARLALRTGNEFAAAELFDHAHAQASESERRRAVFGWRALAHAALDSVGGGGAFLDWAEALRWPLEVRDAIALFDAAPELSRRLDQPGLRERGIAWYARILRREQGLALAESGLRSPRGAERARCFVLGAEQLYRLRRDRELTEWLARAWPDSLSDDDRATLLAYPWGVRRRSGNSLQIAAGFDSIATQFAQTARGSEALWEAAWQYELSGDSIAAEERFARYAQDSRAPWRSGAAARAIVLPLRRGEPELVLERYAQLGAQLNETQDRSAACWALARAGEQLERNLPEDASCVDLWSPFDRPPPHPWRPELSSQGLPIDDLVQALFERQRDAFERVAEEFDGEELSDSSRTQLDAARDFYRNALLLEGDYVLNALSASSRRSVAVQYECARLAWSMGRAERQARVGFQLRALLRGRSEELDRALECIAHPTPFAREFLATAEQQDLPAGLLWSIARRESFYDPAVVSLAGAYGLLQLLPSTAASMAALGQEQAVSVEALRTPLLNLRLGSRYVRQLLDQTAGDVYQTLAAYNAGEANGQRWSARRGPDEAPESVMILISYSETRAYVYHVLRFWRLYADLYPELGRWDGLPEG